MVARVSYRSAVDARRAGPRRERHRWPHLCRCSIPPSATGSPVVRAADGAAGAAAGRRSRAASTRSSSRRPAAARRWRRSSGASTALMFAPRARRGASAAACSTSRRSRRSRSTSSATCARRSPASRSVAAARGDAVRRAGDRRPHRRHAGGRARAVPARAGRHPDHDAGVALPAAHVERARGAARRSTRSSSTRSTRSCRPSAARTSRSRSSGSRRCCDAPPQRIGLSATQRPLDEVARFLGGAETAARPTASAEGDARRRRAKARRSTTRVDAEIARRVRGAPTAPSRYRPVTIVDAGEKKQLDADASKCRSRTWRGSATADDIPSGPASQRRPAAVDLDGDPPAAARADPRAPLDADLRQQPPARRAAGRRRSTSSPARRSCARITARSRAPQRDRDRGPAQGRRAARRSSRPRRSSSASTWARSISSSRSRRRRRSRAACSASAAPATRSARSARASSSRSSAATSSRARRSPARCTRARVEATRYPRNPLDVARAADRRDGRRWTTWDVDELFARDPARRAVRRARAARAFEGVLDMLSGRYPVRRVRRAAAARSPGTALAGTLDRARGREARRDRQRRHDSRSRPLRRVPRSARAARAARVGELDEEMVFETPRRRDVRARRLDAGASRRSRTTACSSRRRPGEPGKMPFWKGDARGPAARARAARSAGSMRDAAARCRRPRPIERLDARSRSRPHAPPRTCCSTSRDQAAAAGVVPDDRTIVVERVPRRARRLARLRALAVRRPHPRAVGDGRRRRASASETGRRRRDDVDRRRVRRAVPGGRRRRPIRAAAARPPRRSRRSSCGSSAATALFAAKFRENAGARAAAAAAPRRARARRSGSSASARRICSRSPRATARSRSLLETYRECLRDVFDMPALVDTLRRGRSARDPRRDRRFATAVAVRRVAALRLRRQLPLRRRRAAGRAARAGAVGRSGAAARAARRGGAARAARRRRARRRRAPAAAPRPSATTRGTPTRVHDLLLRLGDLTADEIAARARRSTIARAAIAALERGAARRRACRIAGEPRFVAVEDAARYRDALGVPLPPGFPESLLAAGARSARRPGAALRAHARAVHGRRVRRAATALGRAAAEATLARLAGDGPPARGRVPARAARGREWCDADVLRTLRRRSLARLRHEVEPVEPAALGRLVDDVAGRRRAPRAGSTRCSTRSSSCRARRCRRRSSRREILPARVDGYQPADLDALVARRRGRLGRRRAARRARRARRALPDRSSARAAAAGAPASSRASSRRAIVAHLDDARARRSSPRHPRGRAAAASPARPSTRSGISSGTGSSPTTRSTRCARSRAPPDRARGAIASSARSASRRVAPPAARGPLVARRRARRRRGVTPTEWAAATAQQLLARHGVAHARGGGRRGDPRRVLGASTTC